MVLIAILFSIVAGLAIWGIRKLEARSLRIVGYALLGLMFLYLAGSFAIMVIGFGG